MHLIDSTTSFQNMKKPFIWISYSKQLKTKHTLIQKFPDFHITKLTGTFINHQTRPKAISEKFVYLIE